MSLPVVLVVLWFVDVFWFVDMFAIQVRNIFDALLNTSQIDEWSCLFEEVDVMRPINAQVIVIQLLVLDEKNDDCTLRQIVSHYMNPIGTFCPWI